MPSEAETRRPPNVLLIVSDDHGREALSCPCMARALSSMTSKRTRTSW